MLSLIDYSMFIRFEYGDGRRGTFLNLGLSYTVFGGIQSVHPYVQGRGMSQYIFYEFRRLWMLDSDWSAAAPRQNVYARFWLVGIEPRGVSAGSILIGRTVSYDCKILIDQKVHGFTWPHVDWLGHKSIVSKNDKFVPKNDKL